MPQTFARSTVLSIKVVLAVLAAVLLLVVAAGLAWAPDEAAGVREMNAQPIAFSHKHHVGDVGLDCRFCHVTVENHASPGMPSAQLCLTCHSQLYADQPMLEPLRRAVRTNQPIAWAQVHRLPDYVYFDHGVHVNKGVACVECHGRIDQMALVEKPQALSMKWCLSCHEDPQPHLRPASQVFAMPPPPVPAGAAVPAAPTHTVESRRRLTDCSTCHR